ncbi:DNA polymerase I [Bacteriovoracales bacterium]|nr:DNA polymerase I [Bacteriovoracales bacterium]
MEKRLIIVDISSFIFRAYYAIRPMNAPDGTPTNALNGVLSMLLKLIDKYKPTHLILAQDSKEKTFRHDIYDQYKANRSEPPEDLIPQFRLIDEMTKKMGLKCKRIVGFEADDIIGSLCIQWKSSFEEIFIASSDKDLMQFVGENTKMLDTMKDKIYDSDGVKEKMGVWPHQIVDFLSIVGDSSDNVPGMKGIGVKGASQLLSQYETLDGCISHKGELKGKRLIDAFENYVEDALLSKKLVSINVELSLETNFEETKLSFCPTNDLIDFLKELGFKRDVTRLENLAKEFEKNNGGNIPEEREKTFNHSIVKSSDQINEILPLVQKNQTLSLYTEYDSSPLVKKELLGFSLSLDSESSFYFPVNHQGEASDSSQNLRKEDVYKFLKDILRNDKLEIISEHSKRDFLFFKSLGEIKAKIFDIVQAHYVIDSSGNHAIGALAQKYLNRELHTLDKKGPSFSHLDVESASNYLGIRSCSSYSLAEYFKNELKTLNLDSVYFDMDLKLLPILAKMEEEGILINEKFFQELEDDYLEKLNVIQSNVSQALSEVGEGDELNLRSPKQVGHLLFEKLGLPVISKTKTGYSTSADVLEELAAKGVSEIPRMILEFRELDKLLSTYVKAIPELKNPNTRRVHTHFNQHTAATGRLSSVHPNLQNIPVRTENGKKIRKGFIASPGKLLLTADYSQVELRLLAHFSEDPTMLKAFLDNQDIHTQTASEVLGIHINDVTSNDRSMAKSVNFGLMYGQSSFGLAKALGISRREAKNYITMYFERFSRVKSYMDSLKELCEEKGYTVTLFGRKRFLPDIHSKNRTIKSAAERIAVNSPIQGTAADIIKMAMIDINKNMKEKGLQSKMLLQVHDELIFEIAEDEIDVMREIVKSCMEGVVKLRIPLRVDMATGVNWFDLK